MVSVTQRVSKVKQSRGGYIRPRDFKEIVLSDGIELDPEEIPSCQFSGYGC